MPAVSRGVELIASLYEAAQDPTEWPRVVAEIGRALDAPQVILAHTDPESGAWPLVALHGIREDDWRFYLDEIRDLDPRGVFFRTAPAGTMLVSGQNDDPEALMASLAGERFYRRRVDGYWAAGLVARQTRRSLVGMVAQRPERSGMFGAAELQLLRDIGAHLDHAVRLASRHAQTTLVGALRGQALDSLAIGVVLLDPSGEVVELNRRARAILARQDGLVLAQRRLSAVAPQDRTLLQRLLAEALEHRADGVPRPGGTLRIERDGGRSDYLVAVLPARVGDLDLAGPALGAMVLIRDPDAGPMLSIDALRAAYGLTAAEARLAACLARRPGLVAAAKELGIAHETARQHLKRILLKTGCTGQPELVAMLAADLPLLVGRGGEDEA